MVKGTECNPSNAEHKVAKIFENHQNPVMLVFIG